MEGFLRRAYRRPVDAADVELFTGGVVKAMDGGASFAEAMMAGYAGVLASPRFVYLDEAPGPLDDWALASRLSYFLWNSPPDEALRAAARRLANGTGGPSGDGLALAERVNAWVHHVMRYRHDVTSVDTTAARALGLAQGVCQDYAHVMISICRLAGLPIRYVSGHLLGEGGSHAWVEVVVPDGDGAVAVPFDPTHGRQVGSSYLTIAVGRDYTDVTPTYGTFQGSSPGRLSTVKRLGVSEIDVSEIAVEVE
jgi:transglutaminase-like putative cysteine protease